MRGSNVKTMLHRYWPVCLKKEIMCNIIFPISDPFFVVDFQADSWTNGRQYVSGFEDIEELHKYVFSRYVN